MALSRETQAWLDGLKAEGKMSDEQLSALRTAVDANPAADEYVKGSVLRQSDYSRNSAEIQKAKTDLEKAAADLKVKEDAVTDFQGRLATWQAGAVPAYKQALLDKAAAEGKLSSAMAKIKAVATAAGIPETELGLDDLTMTPPVDPNKKDDKLDTTQFVTKADIQRAIAEDAFVQANIHDFSQEYFELHGRWPKDVTAAVKEATEKGVALKDYLDTKYNMAEARKTSADKAMEAEVKKRVDEQLAQRLSEANLQPQYNRPDLPKNPIFASQLHKPTDPEFKEGGGVPAAIAAFQSGKYAQK